MNTFKNRSLDVVQCIPVEHNIRVNSYFCVCMHFGEARGVPVLLMEFECCLFVHFFLAFLHLTEVNEIFLHAFSRP